MQILKPNTPISNMCSGIFAIQWAIQKENIKKICGGFGGVQLPQEKNKNSIKKR